MPLPAPSIQLVNLSHVEDLADMLARVPGCNAAKKQHFNLASGRAITHEGAPPPSYERMMAASSSTASFGGPAFAALLNALEAHLPAHAAKSCGAVL